MIKHSKRHVGKRGFKSVVLLVAVILMIAAVAYAAKNKATTIRLARTEGTVTVKNSAKEEQSLTPDMLLYGGDHQITSKQSYAWMNLDDKKAVKLDENSESELRKKWKKLEVLLDSGNLFFNVTVPLEKDEAFHIRTSTMVTGIRGTCGWFEVTGDWSTRVYLLTGALESVVINPTDGKSEKTTIKPGTVCDFYVVPLAEKSQADSCRIETKSFQKEDIPGFVLVELVGDDALIQKIYDESGIDLRGLTMEQAQARLKADEEKHAQENEKIRMEASREQSIVAKEPVWNTANGGKEDGIVYLTMPQKAETVQGYLNQSNVKQVVLVPGSGSQEDNTLKVDIAFEVPEGKLFTAKEKVPVQVDNGKTFTVKGTANLRDDVTNQGRLVVLSSNTLRVGGILYNKGDFENTASGRVVLSKGAETTGSFTNEGVIEAEDASAGEALIKVSGGTFAMKDGSIQSANHDSIVKVQDGAKAVLDLSGGEIVNLKNDAATLQVNAGDFTISSLGTDIAGATDTLLGQGVDLSKYHAASIYRTDGMYHLIAQGVVDSHAVVLDGNIKNGTVSAPKEVETGARVTLEIKPENGYQLDSASVHYYNGFGKAPGEAVGLDDSYCFVMPGHDVIISAVFAKVGEETKKYEITWKNWDGTVLEVDKNVLEESVPTYDGAEPTREESDQFSYQFIGWTPEVVSASGDATYVATFNEISKEEPTVAVKGITLDQTSLKLQIGGAAGILTATINPSDATNQKVTWSSSNEAVASVKANGLTATVTGKQGGTATITVKTEDGSKTATCQVTVNASVTGISLDQQSISMNKGNTATLKAAIAPSYATNQKVTWSTSNSGVATVSGNGLTGTVTAKGNGTATITATTEDGGFSASCNISVTTAVTGVTLNNTSLNVNYNPQLMATATLTATINPSGASNQNVTWSTSNSSVADVSGNGLSATVTMKGVGTATITVTTADGGKTASCTVTVKRPVTGVSLDQDKVAFLLGQDGPITLTATVQPTNATDTSVTWRSGNTSVATVSGNGLTATVTPKGFGTTTITATTNDGGYSASCSITVTGYTVRWIKADGTDYKVDQVAHGGSVIAPSGLTRESSPDKDYTFKNWLQDGMFPVQAGATVSGIDKDIYFLPEWEETTRKYTISWCDQDGSLMDTTQVAYGQTPSHAAPSKATDAVGSYFFQGWTTSATPYQPNSNPTLYGGNGAAGLPTVTKDTAYYAYYYIDYTEYDVMFIDGDGKLMPNYHIQFLRYGETFTVPTVPTDMPATIEDPATGEVRTFVGWKLNGGTIYAPGSVPTSITGNMTFEAIYQ